MKAVGLFVLLSLGLFSAGQVNAQCQAGMPSAGNPQCIPPSAWPQNAAPAQPTGPTWKLTWGAIAIDPDHGDVGTSVGQFSKRKAEREALARCSEKGAKGCKKILFTYQNQCAAVAWPSTIGQNAVVKAASGPTIESASEFAIKHCAGPGGGGGCRIVYSGCSDAVLTGG